MFLTSQIGVALIRKHYCEVIAFVILGGSMGCENPAPNQGQSNGAAPNNNSLARTVDPNNVRLEELIRAIRAAPAWSRMSANAIEAEQLMQIIRLSAQHDTESLRHVVKKLVDEQVASPGGMDIDLMSNLFLLNRAIFAVPEWLDKSQTRFLGGWVGIPETGNRVNVLWPLSVNALGHLELTGFGVGYVGDVYDTLGEFDYFRGQYGRRDLASLSR